MAGVPDNIYSITTEGILPGEAQKLSAGLILFRL
jgi:hypothetical protein